MTTAMACDLGRSVWGYPKFVADMDFEQLAGHQAVRMEEGGRQILSLTVSKGGVGVPDRAPGITYASHNGRLTRIRVEVHGVAQWSVGPRSARLELGDHPLADGLRRLKLSRRAIFAKNSLDLRTTLDRGEPIGSADPYAGYHGDPHADGRLTVRYEPGGERHVLHPAG